MLSNPFGLALSNSLTQVDAVLGLTRKTCRPQIEVLGELVIHLVQQLVSKDGHLPSHVAVILIRRLGPLLGVSVSTIQVAHCAAVAISSNPDAAAMVLAVCSEALEGLPPVAIAALEQLLREGTRDQRWRAAVALRRCELHSPIKDITGAHSTTVTQPTLKAKGGNAFRKVITFVEMVIPEGERFWLQRFKNEQSVREQLLCICNFMLPAIMSCLPPEIIDEALSALSEPFASIAVSNSQLLVDTFLPLMAAPSQNVLKRAASCALMAVASTALGKKQSTATSSPITVKNTTDEANRSAWEAFFSAVSGAPSDNVRADVLQILAAVGEGEIGGGIGKSKGQKWRDLRLAALEQLQPMLTDSCLCLPAARALCVILRRLRQKELEGMCHTAELIVSSPVLWQESEMAFRWPQLMSILFQLGNTTEISRDVVLLFIATKLETMQGDSELAPSLCMVLSRMSLPLESSSAAIDAKNRILPLFTGRLFAACQPRAALALAVSLFRFHAGTASDQQDLTKAMQSAMEEEGGPMGLLGGGAWELYRFGCEALNHGYHSLAATALTSLQSSLPLTDTSSAWIKALTCIASAGSSLTDAAIEDTVNGEKSLKNGGGSASAVASLSVSRALGNAVTSLTALGDGGVGLSFQIKWLNTWKELVGIMQRCHVLCQELQLRGKKVAASTARSGLSDRVKRGEPAEELRTNARVKRVPKAFRRLAADFQGMLTSCFGFDSQTIACLRLARSLCWVLRCAADILLCGEVYTYHARLLDGLIAMDKEKRPGRMPPMALVIRLAIWLREGDTAWDKASLPQRALSFESALLSVAGVPFALPRRFLSTRQSLALTLSFATAAAEEATSPTISTATTSASHPLTVNRAFGAAQIPWGTKGTYAETKLTSHQPLAAISVSEASELIIQGCVYPTLHVPAVAHMINVRVSENGKLLIVIRAPLRGDGHCFVCKTKMPSDLQRDAPGCDVWATVEDITGRQWALRVEQGAVFGPVVPLDIG